MNSESTQTEWSWLACLRNHQADYDNSDETTTNPFHGSITNATGKLSSDDLINIGTDGRAVKNEKAETEQKSPGCETSGSSRSIDLELNAKDKPCRNTEDVELQILSTKPYPSRDDEFGILIDWNKEENESWKSGHESEDDLSTDSEKRETALEDLIIEDEEDRSLAQAMQLVMRGVLEGECEFCGREKKPFPSLEEQDTMSTAALYCCKDYEEFINHVVLSSSKRGKIPGNTCSVQGSRSCSQIMKKKLKLNLDDNSSQTGSNTGDEDEEGEKTITTINYQLSSRRFLDNGWTVLSQRDKEALHSETRRHDDLDIEDRKLEISDETSTASFQFDRVTATGKLVTKNYKNGKQFLMAFPDGSGCLFYPSSRVAVLVSVDQSERFSYIVLSDDGLTNEEALYVPQQTILAVADSIGNAVTYHKNGTIWVQLDSRGGIELDKRGRKKKKWKWVDDVNHVHAPPFYPLECQLSSNLSVVINSKYDISAIFQELGQTCVLRFGSHRGFGTPWPIQNPEDNLPASPGVVKIQDQFERNDKLRHDLQSRIRSLLQKISVLAHHPCTANYFRSSNLSQQRTKPSYNIRTARAESSSSYNPHTARCKSSSYNLLTARNDNPSYNLRTSRAQSLFSSRQSTYNLQTARAQSFSSLLPCTKLQQSLQSNPRYPGYLSQSNLLSARSSSLLEKRKSYDCRNIEQSDQILSNLCEIKVLEEQSKSANCKEHV